MSIFQHFRPEEKPFVEKMLEWVELVEVRGITRVTDFLDPRQAEILDSIANRVSGVNVCFQGGFDGAERVRAFIAPDYIEPTFDDFYIALVEIENRNPFSTLTHRDYLGALLHLGVIRDKFGDLLVNDNGAQLILEREMVDFLMTYLQQVGRSAVLLTERSFDQIQLSEVAMEERSISVSSNRLDSVLAEIIRLSRAKVQPLIKSGKVKLNWKVEDTTAAEVSVGDTLSVRGYGRFKILRENGVSKKGNTIFTIGMYKESS